MCGSVGMFLGCTALSACPLAELLRGGGDVDYRSPFDRWDERASVRRTPRRLVAEEGRYFPSELMAVADHPLVRALSPEAFSTVQLRHLHRYLRFTIELETKYVNPVALALASHGYGLDLPPRMRLDAMRVYTDEAYHALVATDLLMQSEARSGVAERRRPPGFAAAFARLVDAAPRRRTALLELVFVGVSETLITGTLSQLPRAREAPSGLRDAVRDHASDEARHHRYFSAVLAEVWSALSPADRVEVGALVPALIDIFLRPDLGPVAADLVEAGLSEDEAALVVAETMGEDRVAAQRARVAESAVRAFEAAGALAYTEVRHAFEDAGLPAA
ncbi:diiron oxygenase [Actinosynnema sp. NPDC091369]